MGFYLNMELEDIGFLESINSEIYVDKTELISFTNSKLGTKQKYICVSRPRRFGKSMAAEMLASYYCCNCNSKELFKNLKITKDPSFEKYLNQFNVFFINIQEFLDRNVTIEAMLIDLQKTLLDDLRNDFSKIVSEKETDLIFALKLVWRKARIPFIFIIDEWDCIFRKNKYNISGQDKYLAFLLQLFKDKSYVQLAYMTGILPIKKYGTHSALNMFDEYSMTDAGGLSEFVGFTDNEVRELCSKYNMDFQEVSRWYDGYCLEKDLHIYNPRAVVTCLIRKKFGSYWTSTETYEALKIYIDMDFDGLRKAIVELLGGGKCIIDPGSFVNDMTTFTDRNDVLTLLVHLGYLAYNQDTKEVSVPNEEIRSEFLRAITKSDWSKVIKTVEASKKLLEDTLQGNAVAVAKGLDAVHQDTTSILQYNDENSLSCVISLAYYSAREEYWVIRELPTGKGFADIVFIPLKHSNKPALIVELKWDKSVEGAIQQIKNKNYVQALENYTGEILLAGINYDKESKTHQCIIEKHQKESSRLMSLF